MQPALVCSRSFPCASGWLPWNYTEASRPALFGLATSFASAAVSLHQNPDRAAAVPCEPSTALGLQAPTAEHSLFAGADDCSWGDEQGMTGLVTKHSSPGSQAKESGAAMAGGAGREDDWQMPCLEPSPERRSVRGAAKRWGPRSPEMPMLVPAISKGTVEETEETLSKQTQLVLSRFQGSVEVDSIDGVDFFSFSNAEDLREFAHSMDQLIEEQYCEPHSPVGSAPSSVARSGVADDEWRESDWAEERQSLVVLPRKTTDITKIKGWRRKAFGSDQTADQTTRWVMDQMNEKAWHQEEEEREEPPSLMTRRATAMAAAGQHSESGKPTVPQLVTPKKENLPAAEASLAKGVRGAFISYSLDEFLEHRSELRVGQLAQLNPNIVPPPDGQGVLALSSPPVVVALAEKMPRQVGPTRQMTARPSRRYGRPQAAQDRHTPPAGPSLVARRRRQSTAPSDSVGEEHVVPSPSKPSAAPASSPLPPSPRPPLPPEESPQKPAAKRVKVEPEEEAPFLAMTSRRLRGSQGAAQSSESKGTPNSSTPRRESTRQASKPSGAAASKKAAASSSSEKKAPDYGVSSDAGDYPLVTETVFSSEQKRLLRVLLSSTQSLRPLTVALRADPCFICPQLDEEDALAAAQALDAPQDSDEDVNSEASPGKPGRTSTAGKEEVTQPQAASMSKGAQKTGASTKEPSSKGSLVEPPRTPRKARVRPTAVQVSPTEATQSTRTRREIRLPARFQDSALYFSSNGDAFDPALPSSPWQRGRPLGMASNSKVAPQALRPPVVPATPTQAAAVPSSSSSPTSWCSSSSSSCSSPSSSRSSSPCESCSRGSADASQAPPQTRPGSSQAVHMNGSRTLRQLSRLKTDGFVNLHSIQNSQASTTPEGSIDVTVDSLSDSDEDASSAGEEAPPKKVGRTNKQKASRERVRRKQLLTLFMQLQSIVFRSPSSKRLSKVTILGQANRYLCSLKVIAAHLKEEKHWLQRRQAALKARVEESRRNQRPARLPKAEPRPPPLPAEIHKVCDLSQPMMPPLCEASEEVGCTSSGATSSAMLDTVKNRTSGHSCSKTNKQHKAKDKEPHRAKAGTEQSSKHKPKAEPPQKVEESAAKPPSATKVEAGKCDKPGGAETSPGSGELTPVAYTLNGGHIGALRSIPTPTDVPKKYTLYPTKGTALGDLSKLAAAAQHLIGPCIIKRVKLRSGQTVYVYRQPNADSTSTVPEGTTGGDSPEESNQPQLSEPCSESEGQPQVGEAPSEVGQRACQGDESVEVMNDNETEDAPSQGHEGGVQQGDDNDDTVLEDTSEWISGDGDTCIVMKLPVSSDEEDDSSSSSES